MPNRRLLFVSLFIAYSLIGLAIWHWHQSSQGQTLGSSTDLSTAEVYALTNLMRQQGNLNPLTPSQELEQAARSKAQHMIEHQYWDHYDSNSQTTPWDFIDQQHYTYSHAGENLAKGYYSSITVVNAWMESPAHRSNLLSPDYQQTGVAIVPQAKLLGEETTLIIQYFAKPIDPQLANQLTSKSHLAPPPLSSLATQKQIITVKPLIVIFGSAGLLTFCTSFIVTLFWLKHPPAYHPPNRHWKT